MELRGYLYFRSVDSIRHPIYKLNDKYFYVYKEKKYKLNIPEEFKEQFIHLTLSNSHNYNVYEKEIKELGYPKTYDINGKVVINKDPSTSSDIELTPHFS